MQYLEFKNRFQSLPLIAGKDLLALEDPRNMKNQLARWVKKGLITQLRKGLYLLGKTDRRVYPGRLYLASQLYNPSYISLELALNHYGIIPEQVMDTPSISTKKTTSFKNEFGLFTYQTIKPKAFRGFTAREDASGLTYFIAEPEKAVVDFIYLNLPKFKIGDAAVFTESYRFQRLEQLNTGKLKQYAELFNNAKLTAVVKTLMALVRQEKAHD